MVRPSLPTLGRTAAAGLLLLGAGRGVHAQSDAGCTPSSRWQRTAHRLEARCLGYPSEFVAAPLGLSVSEHYQPHVANGAAARMTLYDYDFSCGGAELNYRGRERLARIAELAMRYPYPVLIEVDPRCAYLAAPRRLEVLRELARCAPAVSLDRVVLGGSGSRPTSGVESQLIYQTLILQTGSAGARPETGSGSFDGSGTGSGFQPTPGFLPGGSSGSGGGR